MCFLTLDFPFPCVTPLCFAGVEVAKGSFGETVSLSAFLSDCVFTFTLMVGLALTLGDGGSGGCLDVGFLDSSHPSHEVLKLSLEVDRVGG